MAAAYKKCRHCRRYKVSLIFDNHRNVIGWYCFFCYLGFLDGQKIGSGWIELDEDS